jgi:hypothetical protein
MYNSGVQESRDTVKHYPLLGLTIRNFVRKQRLENIVQKEHICETMVLSIDQNGLKVCNKGIDQISEHLQVVWTLREHWRRFKS